MKKFLPDLEIPEDLLNRIIEHARQEYPLESCGILAGKSGRITKFYPMGNTKKSSSCYLMEPEEQFTVFQEIEKEGLELSAIYHSHPHTACLYGMLAKGYSRFPVNRQRQPQKGLQRVTE